MGWDFANYDNFPEDTNGFYGHGTEVAGPAIALSNNNFGIASIAQNCMFKPFKIFNDVGVNSYVQYSAVAYASDMGCKVINLSWGSWDYEQTFYYQYEQDILNYAAIENDAVIVAATFPKEGRFFTAPGDYNNVLSVLALNPDDTKSYPQATHENIDMSSPSMDFFTTTPKGGFGIVSGISVGQALVTGAAALVRSKYPEMNYMEVQELLRVTARNIDTVKTNKNYKEKLGHGCLDIYKALTDSTTPAIRLMSYELKRISGDTASLQLGFKNYLRPTKNLQLIFRSITGGFELLDSVATVGVIGKKDSAISAYADIKVRILPHAAGDTISYVRVGMLDTANHYSDYQYFYMNRSLPIPVITATEETTPTANLKFYPNPCEKELFVEMDGATKMEVLDHTGKIMSTVNAPSDFNTIPLDGISSGIYFLRCYTPSGVFSSKFLKK